MSDIARRSRSSVPADSIISTSDDAILYALHRYSVLSSSQVCRLLYSLGSLSWVQAKLKRLVDLEYLQRLFLPRPSRFGSAPSIFTLARKGLNHLAAQGIEVQKRHRPSERQGSYFFLAHTLAVNDVLVSFELLCRRSPNLQLRAMLHESALRRDAAYVEDERQRRVAVVPDGWITLVIDGAYEMALALEVDRGTEGQAKWRRKVRALVAWSQGTYQEKMGTTSLTIAVITTPGVNRMHELLRWTEAELTALGRLQQGDLFRLTCDPQSLRPEDLILASRWVRPFDREAAPLLDLGAQRDRRRGATWSAP